MKIYTKTGDRGDTSLADGKRVRKSDPRVELYGTVDELNSFIGGALSFIGHDFSEKKTLTEIQNILFELGSELAGFIPKNSGRIILDEDVSLLEKSMDTMSAELPQMRSFVLPGGTKAASMLHIARTVCRRLERQMTELQENAGTVSPEALIYINRLSDYLFTAARYANFKSGNEDVPWKSRAKANAG
ncbi:MAG TPA: cob(I)yrinic acid a,c-diamide adenosyltransferase [Leptospiraceae bacterium]|nr:cob(I)yrinic acid a,c-diamide adenosyltransferase [Leptospiraceae bacterium]HMZ57671.1 cob(I)yrinic acid a,c-diamide adenosyltransferase [Leptospiraceae bacterium]